MSNTIIAIEESILTGDTMLYSMGKSALSADTKSYAVGKSFCSASRLSSFRGFMPCGVKSDWMRAA